MKKKKHSENNPDGHFTTAEEARKAAEENRLLGEKMQAKISRWECAMPHCTNPIDSMGLCKHHLKGG